jgi:hypothetical protein
MKWSRTRVWSTWTGKKLNEVEQNAGLEHMDGKKA